MKKHEFGKWAEEIAADYLAGKGFRILERRVRFRDGEIDLIVAGGDGLFFVEVKARRDLIFGDVVEALTAQKLRRMRKVIVKWRMRSGDKRPGRILFLGIFVDRDERVTIEEHLIE